MKRVGAVALVLSMGLIALWWFHPAPAVSLPIFRPRNHAEYLTTTGSGDGQVILLLAQGGHVPPGVSAHDIGWYYNNEGYRWMRPLPIVLTYLTSFGQRRLMAYSMMAWSIIGAFMLVLVTAQLLVDARRSPWWGLLILAAPGVWSGLQWFSLDPLGLALAMWGWRTNNSILLAIAGLQHEVLLVFALARKRLLPIAVFGAWFLIVKQTWDYVADPANIGVFGFLHIRAGLAVFVATVLLATAAAADPRFRWPALGFIAVMFMLGPLVYFYWVNFARILLAVWVMGFIALVSWRRPEHLLADTEHLLDAQRGLA